jgi:general bacterial porin, GBP family
VIHPRPNPDAIQPSLKSAGPCHEFYGVSGASGFFKLEGAINTASGQIANNGRSVLNNANSLSTISSASAINGQAFSRAQYVGISYPLFGSIQVGRTVAFSTEQSTEFDPLHASGLYSPIGYSGTIGGGLGITENARLDNSVRYDNKIGPVSFGLQYKIGQTDSSEAADVGSVLEAMVAYRGGPLSVELAASETRNTPAISYKLFTNDVGLRVSNTFGFMLGAKFDLTQKAAIYAGVEHTDQTIPSSSNNWSTQITSYYAMPIAGLVTAKAFASSWGDAPIRVLWVGADYQFTDSFSVNVGYYNVNNEANSHNDQYTNQQFAILPDYKFDEHFDVYAGVLIAHYTGAYLTQFSPITVATGNVLYGIGCVSGSARDLNGPREDAVAAPGLGKRLTWRRAVLWIATCALVGCCRSSLCHRPGCLVRRIPGRRRRVPQQRMGSNYRAFRTPIPSSNSPFRLNGR